MPTTSSYQREALENGTVRFSVTAAEKRLPVFRAILIGMCFGALPAAFLAIPGFIAGSIAGFFIFQAAARHGDFRKRGGDSTFSVSPASIEIGGVTVPADQIHRLIIRNVFSGAIIPLSSCGIIAGGTGMLGGAVVAAVATTNAAAGAVRLAEKADQKHSIEIGHKLDVEYQGKAVTLAGGMTETTAYGLMQEIGKVLWGK